jgi:hypothetical protein
LTSVTIGVGVAGIGEYAFENCSDLASIRIPASVISIGEYAFESCDVLSSVFFLGNSPPANGTVFSSDNNATVYYLPGSSGWGATYDTRPAVLWEPLIQTGGANFGVQAGQFGFDITGHANIPIVVEACTNLANPVWVPLQTLTLTNGSYYFSDPQWTNYPNRYYGIGFP